MALDITGTRSSRVRKPIVIANALRRTSSSPFTGHPRVKSNQTKNKRPVDEDQYSEVQLGDTGRIIPLATDSPVANVEDAIEHAFRSMFDEIPERAGMNSTRISEVLNFRKALPPVLSLAHVHSLVGASSRTEREISILNSSGKARRISIVGRGNEISGLGEVLVLQRDVVGLVEQAHVGQELRNRWIKILERDPRAKSLPPGSLTTVESTELIKSGFLVSPSASATNSNKYTSAIGKITSSVHIAASVPSGSQGATGGPDIFSGLGGRRGLNTKTIDQRSLVFSVPNLGPYLRLLTDARSHMMGLLEKSKHGMAPLDILKERWNGAIESDSQVSNAKKARGEFAGILPGRTKKWKHFYGLNFDWVLQECLGAGLVELFETHSVGYGVRRL
ncbi:MAG: hypothetical protein Q9160_008644 [Pyrenula sp. 1 TL-2023]